MARLGSRGALPPVLAGLALAGSGAVAWALWPGAPLPAAQPASPPASAGGAPVGPLALTPPTTAGTEAPLLVTVPTTAAAPPAGTTTAPPTTAAPTTAAPTSPAPACATLTPASPGELAAGCYVEVAANSLSFTWPPGEPATSSLSLTRGQVWNGLLTSVAPGAGGLRVGAALTNHSALVMRFPAGLAVEVTLTTPGAAPVTVVLTAPGTTGLAPGASVRLDGPVSLSAPGLYQVAAAVTFSVG